MKAEPSWLIPGMPTENLELLFLVRIIAKNENRAIRLSP